MESTMKKIEAIDRFNTTFGLVFIVLPGEILRVGDAVECDGMAWRIVGIDMPSVPTEEDIVGLIVEPI